MILYYEICKSHLSVVRGYTVRRTYYYYNPWKKIRAAEEILRGYFCSAFVSLSLVAMRFSFFVQSMIGFFAFHGLPFFFFVFYIYIYIFFFWKLLFCPFPLTGSCCHGGSFSVRLFVVEAVRAKRRMRFFAFDFLKIG